MTGALFRLSLFLHSLEQYSPGCQFQAGFIQLGLAHVHFLRSRVLSVVVCLISLFGLAGVGLADAPLAAGRG